MSKLETESVKMLYRFSFWHKSIKKIGNPIKKNSLILQTVPSLGNVFVSWGNYKWNKLTSSSFSKLSIDERIVIHEKSGSMSAPAKPSVEAALRIALSFNQPTRSMKLDLEF